MYFYYCPKCGYEKEILIKDKPRLTFCNLRDGYGMPIFHYPCEKCGAPEAGFMQEKTGDEDEKEYYKWVISFYQDKIKKEFFYNELYKD